MRHPQVIRQCLLSVGRKKSPKVSSESGNFIVHFKARGHWPKGLGSTTVFKVQTCYGADTKAFSEDPSKEKVVIPPFEKFNVTKVIEDGEKVEIHLDSIGTNSKYNCEWLKDQLDSQRDEVIEATKATTATMATLASRLHEVTVATTGTVATMVTNTP
ncbi:hypothetical protein TURU_133471 [Turdus rufiventris]|nr:hypothetical protein TURU_133471 [Turdus rufiventris]